MAEVARVFEALGLTVLERGWLSSNNIVFRKAAAPATVVDTGYATHAPLTVSLVREVAGPAGVGRIVNTHLHSDHCGGNAALQREWDCEVWVPEASFDAVQRWDAERLSYERTGQRCERFEAHRGIRPGELLDLGPARWRAIAAPGHDPEALMFWQEEHRVLVTADALWEERLAIIFPELAGEPGFDAAEVVLARIESLAPAIVIPGHGAPFTGVERAIERSRQRIRNFRAEPRRHLDYGTRALTMFHMLEHRARRWQDVAAWLAATPIFGQMQQQLAPGDSSIDDLARRTLERLVADGQLVLEGDLLRLP